MNGEVIKDVVGTRTHITFSWKDRCKIFLGSNVTVTSRSNVEYHQGDIGLRAGTTEVEIHVEDVIKRKVIPDCQGTDCAECKEG